MTFAGEGALVGEVRVDLLHRAVENVVRNAIQHTAPRTTVEVTAAAGCAPPTGRGAG